jgi:tryptophan 7-halogenase
MDRNGNVKSILIVGGGTAGYISALILKTRFGNSIEINIVKSDEIGIVGVGEGSTEHWNEFLRYTNISYKEIIKECDATCKIGIFFKNWSDSNYMHSVLDTQNVLLSQTHFGYLKLISDDCNKKELNDSLSWNNKVHIDCVYKNYPPTNQYHFNTFKLNNFLQRKCLEKNIKIFEDKITNVDVNEKGIINYVKGFKKNYKYDFYIDCTGFKKLLISKLGAKWNSYGKFLKMKEAIAFPTEDSEEYNIYTTAEALDYGWMFSIPTYGRQGNGYIFDSDFINADQAKKEVEKLLNREIHVSKHIKFDPGSLNKTWINNCVAVGLSANFVEPLEATSIGTSIQQVFLLMHYLPKFNSLDIKEYNYSVNSIMENIKNFILLHYVTKKNNSKFWKYVKEIELTDFLKNNMQKWKNRLPIEEDFNFHNTKYKLFNSSNFIQVLYGLDILDTEKLKENFLSLNTEHVKQINNHINLIRKNEKLNCLASIGHKKYLNLIKEGY